MYVLPFSQIQMILSVVQMGIFTELAILYSKYRPEKRELSVEYS